MDDTLPQNKLLKALSGLAFSKKSAGIVVDLSDTDKEVDHVIRLQIESHGKEGKKIPPFPIEVFPVSVQGILRAAKDSLNFPTDFFGTSMLFCASVAIGNTYRIEVMKGWEEGPCLFVANVGKPNTNKSHPLSFALRPIYEKDKKGFIDYEKRKIEYDQTVRNIKTPSDRKAYDESNRPTWQKSLVNDFTREALCDVHKRNIRGIGVHADELAGWFKNFNRYNQGSDQEFWLSVWSGQPINVDRKSSEPVFIPVPLISVAGNIPTRILYELGQGNRAQNGFTDRILFAFPDGLEKPYWTESELDSSFITKWKDLITKLLDLELELSDSSIPIPKVIKFTPEALHKLKQWARSNTDLCKETEDELLAGAYGKFDVQIARLALILEMLHFACGESDKSAVGIASVDGALQLVEYFQATALKVHSIISSNNPLSRLTERERQTYESLPDSFTTMKGHDIAKGCKMPPDTFNKFLRREKDKLFMKIKKGEYGKLI